MAKINVELTFPKELKDEPVIYQMITNFKIVLNIQEASFSTDMGWALLTLEGEKSEIDRLFEYLGGKGVTIEPR